MMKSFKNFCIILSVVFINVCRQELNIVDIQLRNKRTLWSEKLKNKWNFPIQYWVDDKSGLNATIIDNALKEISDNTCITWKKMNKRISRTAGLNVMNRGLCGTFVGMISKSSPQEISFISKCIYKGRIQHEFCHSLGFIHQNKRPDSGKFIKINYDNILENKERKLKILKDKEVLTFGMTYDYGSQFHHPANIYSATGLSTITTNDPNYQRTIGQDTGLQFTDFKYLNMFYCGEKCKNKKNNCKNNGYLDPKDCSRCKCPPHYAGKLCNKYKHINKKCKKIVLKAEEKTKTLSIQGKLNCFYYISTNSKHKIELVIENSDLPKLNINSVCERGKSLEVLYRKDPSVVGAMFCGINKNITIKSEGEKVSINYVGGNQSNFLILKYKMTN